MTGIVRDPSQTETLELALKLHPQTKRVHVVAYAPLVEGYEERMAAALAAVARGVTLTYANEPTLAEALETIRRLPADSLIFYARYSPIPTGRVMLPDEMFVQIVDASPVPIYGSNDTNLGWGVLGGMMRSESRMAARLGEITLRILEGAKPEDIPIESAQLTPMFDWRQMQRWGLNPASLPPGSEIRFRVPTVVGALRVLHHRDPRCRERPAAPHRRAAAIAGTPASCRQHHPGKRSLAAGELRSHSPNGRPTDQRARSGAR